jgi:anti-sigma regulatory factor (Ser/Thr protein kinase)
MDGSGGFHVDDDLALMAIAMSPSAEEWLLEPDLEGAAVRQTQQWLGEKLAARIDAARMADLELIAEELLSNVARAAQGRGPVRASVQCTLAPDEITLVFRDDAAPFDPLARAAPRLADEVEGRTVGGLGIHIVRELADHIRYERKHGENVLEIRLNRITATEGS